MKYFPRYVRLSNAKQESERLKQATDSSDHPERLFHLLTDMTSDRDKVLRVFCRFI